MPERKAGQGEDLPRLPLQTAFSLEILFTRAFFFNHTRLPRGRTDVELDFLEPMGAPASHHFRTPIKAVVLSQEPLSNKRQ